MGQVKEAFINNISARESLADPIYDDAYELCSAEFLSEQQED